MTRKKIFALVFILLLVIAVGLLTKFLFLDKQVSSVAALRIDSIPPATVYLDDKPLGQTPFSTENLKPGNHLIKLLVVGIPGTFYPWEGKVKLTPDTLTYISRDIGKNDEESGGQLLYLEKIPANGLAELALVVTPSDSLVKIDGLEKGSGSTIYKDLPLGDHEIAISHDGFSDQIVKSRLVAGMRLNVQINLARLVSNIANPNNISTPATSSSTLASASAELPKPYVLITETGTGFLRVRSDPTITATETARVKPGEKYPLVTELTGWVKIALATSSGWVSDQFVKKFK